MCPTALALQRQIERSRISIEEFEVALDSLASNSIRIEAVVPKMVRFYFDDLMLRALFCARTDRN